jgi:hypothetical protein
MVRVESLRRTPLDGTMNEIRLWLDGEKIEPVDFKIVISRAGFGFEIGFKEESEAELFQQRFSSLRLKVNVMVVDDDPDIREMLAVVLREHGYSVDLAATATEARERLLKESYDAVISDWSLPGGDGTLVADWGQLTSVPRRLS